MHKRRQKPAAIGKLKESPTELKIFMDKYLELPIDLRNDMIYCQRALIAHIKVHQMVVDNFDSKNEADDLRKRSIHKELERQMYQINAEQQYLFLKVHEIIDEFHKLLNRNGIKEDKASANLAIMKMVMPLLNDKTLIINPKLVSRRSTEEQLISKYLNVQKHTLDDQDQEVIITTEPVETIDLVHDTEATVGSVMVNDTLVNENKQVSLLKPISQRMVGIASTSADGCDSDEVDVESIEPKPVLNKDSIKKKDISAADSEVPLGVASSPQIELPVSKNVKMCRLNLTQALKKARNESIAAKAAASTASSSQADTSSKSNLISYRLPPTPVVPIPDPKLPRPIKTTTITNSKLTAAQSTTPSQPGLYDSQLAASRADLPSKTAAAATTGKKLISAQATPIDVNSKAIKQIENKVRLTQGTVISTAAADVKSIDLLSTSEDSIPEADTTPPGKYWPEEVQNLKTHPDHIGKERFLQLFDLFTPEMLAQMQQRRSKRRRRNVHNNERSDYHYGRIEFGSTQTEEKGKKKRKVFLLSPRVKRLQSKGPKRANSDKNIEAASSRSNTTSPDGNRNRCNECNKNGGSLIQCGSCEAFYHKLCHRRENDLKPTSERNNSKEISLVLCPTCKRAQVEILKKDRFNYLNKSAKELDIKMSREKDRRVVLQQEGNSYKVQMSQLINFVNAIKDVEENDNSE